MRPVETLGKIDGDGFSLDGSEAFSLSSAVDCRIGSLEIWNKSDCMFALVDCRIGSLEMVLLTIGLLSIVDCRIGSLENVKQALKDTARVDCRIGSLERILNKRDIRLYC